MLKKLLIIATLSVLIIAPASADDLGPATTSNAGSDPSTLNLLQPAGSGNIPSSDALTGGLNLSGNNSSLQPAGTKNDLPSSLSLSSEADGAPQSQSHMPAQSNHFMPITLGIMALFLLISAFFLFRISKLTNTEAPTDAQSLPETEDSLLDPSNSDQIIPEPVLPAAEVTPTPGTPQPEPTALTPVKAKKKSKKSSRRSNKH